MNTNMTCIKDVPCILFRHAAYAFAMHICGSCGVRKTGLFSSWFNRACNSCVYAGLFCLDVLLRLPYHYLHIVVTKGSAYSSDYSKLVYAETGCTPYK